MVLFLAGVFVGATIGIFTASLMAAAGRGE